MFEWQSLRRAEIVLTSLKGALIHLLTYQECASKSVSVNIGIGPLNLPNGSIFTVSMLAF